MIVDARKPVVCARCNKPIERGQLFLVAYSFEPERPGVGYRCAEPMSSRESGIVHQDCRKVGDAPRESAEEVAVLVLDVVHATRRDATGNISDRDRALVWEIVERLYGRPLTSRERSRALVGFSAREAEKEGG